MKRLFRLSLWILPGPVFYAVYKLAFLFPDVVEKVYSRGVYPVLTYIGYLNGLLPVSVIEIVFYALAVLAVWYIVMLVRTFAKPKGERLYYFFRRVIILLISASFVLSSFSLGWGINYARNTLAKSMGLETRAATTEELISICEKLGAEASELRARVSENEEGVFRLSLSRRETLDMVSGLYDENAPDYMNLGTKSRIKGVFTKNVLSSTQTTGIFLPFTYECNVNIDMPDLFLPATAAHEYAHLKGFAREDECNFISWYVTRNCGDADFKYSGAMLALTYAMNSLYKDSKEEYKRIYSSLNEGIKRDWNNDNLYWDEFETEFAESTSKVYNNYLKSNGVADGSKSYGRMLDLIIALDRAGRL